MPAAAFIIFSHHIHAQNIQNEKKHNIQHQVAKEDEIVGTNVGLQLSKESYFEQQKKNQEPTGPKQVDTRVPKGATIVKAQIESQVSKEQCVKDVISQQKSQKVSKTNDCQLKWTKPKTVTTSTLVEGRRDRKLSGVIMTEPTRAGNLTVLIKCSGEAFEDEFLKSCGTRKVVDGMLFQVSILEH